MTLAVPGASDSHRGPVFLVSPDGQRGPTALTFFCVFFLSAASPPAVPGVGSASWIQACIYLQ